MINSIIMRFYFMPVRALKVHRLNLGIHLGSSSIIIKDPGIRINLFC